MNAVRHTIELRIELETALLCQDAVLRDMGVWWSPHTDRCINQLDLTWSTFTVGGPETTKPSMTPHHPRGLPTDANRVKCGGWGGGAETCDQPL